MAQRKSLNVNGKSVRITIDDPEMPLLYALRDNLALKGPRFGCGLGAMRRLHGACRWQGGALLRDAALDAHRQAKGRHARRPRLAGQAAPGAARLHRGAGGAMRLLHQRHDHGIGGASSRPTRSRATPISSRRSPTISVAAVRMRASSRAVKRAAGIA